MIIYFYCEYEILNFNEVKNNMLQIYTNIFILKLEHVSVMKINKINSSGGVNI